MPQKRLQPEEIKDPKVRACYNFGTQEARGPKGRQNLWIERTCINPDCKEPKRWVKVNWVRKSAPHNGLSGYCHSCVPKRVRGTHKTGEFAKSWRGGRHSNGHGYMQIRMPKHPHAGASGYVREHRLVMEKILGRYLNAHESVHHKNGVRSDNRPKNLELWVKSQPSGQRVEDLVSWAGYIMRTYGPVLTKLRAADHLDSVQLALVES